MSSKLQPHRRYSEPLLSFHPERENDTSAHPLSGLLQYGPYTSGVLPDPIRIATIAPFDESQLLFKFLRYLHESWEPQERKNYLERWPGFREVFGVKITAATKSCLIETDKDVEKEITECAQPHLVLAGRLTRLIQKLALRRTEFDVIFIYLPNRWSSGFDGGQGEDFDLRDHLKAVCAKQSMPIQIIREGGALTYRDRASVMWRIGIATYVKAGGVPWKLANLDADVAHIGISYAVRPPDSNNNTRFVTCCSQVFDADGSGLEFIAYDTNDVQVQRSNPFLSRTEMFRVMTRSMDLYRRRHAGRVPRRVIVHKSTEFKQAEIDGAMEALQACDEIDLIQIVEDVAWQGVRFDLKKSKSSQPTGYPVERGTLLSLSDFECLLWLHGDSDVTPRKSYFQGGKGTPRPLKLIRHAGHGNWDDTAISALALSKMNWNNDALYDHLPVTMSYSKALARVIKRMDGLGSTPYQFRFFM